MTEYLTQGTKEFIFSKIKDPWFRTHEMLPVDDELVPAYLVAFAFFFLRLTLKHLSETNYKMYRFGIDPSFDNNSLHLTRIMLSIMHVIARAKNLYLKSVIKNRLVSLYFNQNELEKWEEALQTRGENSRAKPNSSLGRGGFCLLNCAYKSTHITIKGKVGSCYTSPAA